MTDMEKPGNITVCMLLYCFDVGGSERLGLQLMKHYQSAGMRVICCATRRGTGPIVKTLEELRIPHLALDLEGRSRIGRISAKIRLLRWLIANKVNCIHAQHFCVYSDLRLISPFTSNITQIITEHTAEPILNDKSYAKSTSKTAGKADHVVAINEVVRDAICSVSGIKSNNVKVIENGIDTSRFTPGKKSAGEEVHVTWLGRLHPDKDILTGLKAFRIATDTHKLAMKLHIVGDGIESRVAHTYVEDNNLSSVVAFEGELRCPVDVLQRSDILLMSSRTEGTPLAMLEAMSCGLPIVATAVGGIPATVSKEIGLLSPAGDPDTLALNLVAIANNKELRARMGSNARELALRRFSEQRMASMYLNLIMAQE